MSTEPLSLSIPAEVLDAIAERVAKKLGIRESEPAGFLDVAGAASFLACPPSRIYALTSAGRLPVHRDGSRLLFDPSELRAYVANGGARRP